MPKDYLKIPRQKTAEQALSSLMALCAKAEKSSGDALRLLYKWKIEDKDKHKILDKLIELRFIDDSRYAAAFVREKLNLSGWGAYKIRTALIAKGISKEIIDLSLSDLDRDKMRERLTEQIRKKRDRLTSTSSDVYIVKGKLMRYALSLGYDYDMVSEVIERLDENA